MKTIDRIARIYNNSQLSKEAKEEMMYRHAKRQTEELKAKFRMFGGKS